MFPAVEQGRAKRRAIRHRLALGVALIAVSSISLAATLHHTTAGEGTAGKVVIGKALTAERTGSDIVATALASSSVRVIAESCNGTLYGSGVILNGDRVLTARHVVEGATRISVETENGHQFRAERPLADDAGRDAAILSVAGIGHASGAVLLDEPERGEPVAVAGHPEGGRLHVDYTTVMTYTSQPPLAAAGTRVMILDSGFAEGMSGGPVSDRGGHVVGVAIGVETNTNVGIATPASQLGALLRGSGTRLSAPQC